MGGGRSDFDLRFMANHVPMNFSAKQGCVDPNEGLVSAAMESMHEYVISQLQAAKGTWPKVAREADMSLRTIEKIARRESADPAVSFIERLNRYFRGRRS